jgi:uncharacterized membrane protein
MKLFFLYLMVLLYVAAGLNHFVHANIYLRIMPRYLPYPLQIVYLSGALEILCAVLLVFPATRRMGAWCLILLLIAVFPANVQMAVDYYRHHDRMLWLALLRLPLQVPLIWWARAYTMR